MEITLTLNGKKLTRMMEADTVLLDFLRKEGCYSVKRGCDTTNCGLCTVFMDDKPVLSCAVLAACRRPQHRNDGGNAAGGSGIRCIYCRPGRGAVRLLQPRHDYERYRAAA